jgi:short-subunit dehydrogenase
LTPSLVVEPRYRTRNGHILICSSCLSKIGIPNYAHYCASKACQDMYGRSLRAELAPAGVHVSTVHPVGTTTEFFDKAAERNPDARLVDRDNNRFMQRPERVASAIVRCLQRPRSEVWTSPLQYAMALSGLTPTLRDNLISRRARRRASRSD